MRGLFVFLLGVAVGGLAVVLAYTLDDSPDPEDATATILGNARYTVDEGAFATIVNQQVEALPSFSGALATEVTVREDGLIDIVMGTATEPPTRVALTLDPEVVNGKLELTVVASEFAENITPEELVPFVQRALEERLIALAGTEDYTLVSIVTLDGLLTLEIEV